MRAGTAGWTARALGAVLVVGAAVTAAPAHAGAQESHRLTLVMRLAGNVTAGAADYAQRRHVDGRSVSAWRAALAEQNDGVSAGFAVTLSGLVDRNRDGLDDDGTVTARLMSNRAVITMHRSGEALVADGGFVFTHRRAVLKETAQATDRMLRLVVNTTDPWDMCIMRIFRRELPPGVQMVSDHDGNDDGYDDDGRLTFLARGKAVTLTIGNTPRQVGRVTYGPTWQATPPRRTHHPIAPPSGCLTAG